MTSEAVIVADCGG